MQMVVPNPMHPVRTLVVFGLLAGMLMPCWARAQWVETPGTGWVQLRISHHRTDTRFGPDGDVEPLFNAESRSITTSAFLTAAVGLFPGIDAWAQAPFHHLQFNDAVRDRTSTGIGDPKFFLRAGPKALGLDIDLPIAVRGGVKFPVGDFPVDVEVIPLTEGQRDWELLVELGYSFYPIPMYVMGWVGYRWREFNDRIERKPGDERIAYVAVGGSRNHFTWKVAADGLFGVPPVRRLSSTGLEIELEQDARRLVQLLPAVGWNAGPGTIELGARIPIDGQNLPAGPALTLGYFVNWSDPLW
jgi:hypothetical protein